MSSKNTSDRLKKFVFGDPELESRDWPVDHVPRSERRDLWSISAVLLGFVFFAGTLYAGAEVGTALGFGQMLGAMAVGYAILGAYVATLCGIAAKAGLTTVLLSRYTFGRLGAKWADLLLGGTQIGWFGVTIPMVAVPTARFFDVNTPTWVAALVLAWGLLHLATAYVGYDGMELLSKVAVPTLVLIGALSIGIALLDAGGVGGLFGGGSAQMGFGTAVTIVVGTFISGGTQAPNWARFAENKRIAFWAGLIAFLLGNGFLFLSGAVGGAAYDVTPAGDLYAVLAAQGLAGLGLIALVLNIWTTNDNAAYAFGVAGSEAFDVEHKRPFVLAGGTVGIALALLGIADAFVPWLNLLGQYVPPLGGVIIADFLLCWRLRIPRMEDVEFARVRSSAVAGYLAGCVVAAVTAGTVVPGVTTLRLLPGITSLNGLVAAMAVHALLFYGLEKRGLLSGHRVADDAEYC